MKRQLAFEVLGPVVGKQRPRITKGGHVFTPKKTRDYEKRVMYAFRGKYKGHKTLKPDVPVSVQLEIEHAMPKSWSRRKQSEALGAPCLSGGQSDVDNIVKSVLDGLNGVVWHDDRQVWRITATQHWGAADGVTVMIGFYEQENETEKE